MNLVPQRWVSPFQRGNQCIRFLSEKSRNRKWELPSPTIFPNPPKISSSSTSAEPLQKQSHGRHTQFESKKAQNYSKGLSAVRNQSSKNPQSYPQIPQNKLGKSNLPRKSPSADRAKLPPKVSKAGLESWKARKLALKEKFSEGWLPGRRISPEAMEGIRILKKQRPHFTATQLADFFKISPEAIRRILKSQWRPSPEEQTERIHRWQRRREKVATAAIQRQTFRQQATILRRYRGLATPASFSTRRQQAIGGQFSRGTEQHRTSGLYRRDDNQLHHGSHRAVAVRRTRGATHDS